MRMFGIPKTEGYDLGPDGTLVYDANAIGANFRAPLYLAMSRSGSLVAAAAVTPYLLFDCPPLPPGSFIRVMGACSLTTSGAATGVINLGISGDWLGATPTVTLLASGGDAGATTTTGLYTLTLGISARKNSFGAGTTVATSGAIVLTGASNLVTTVDYGASGRYGVYCTNAGGGSTLRSCFVEVFIPRIDR